MADTSWEYIIPDDGIYNDTSQDFEVIIPGGGIVNEGVTAAGGLSIPVAFHHLNKNIGR